MLLLIIPNHGKNYNDCGKFSPQAPEESARLPQRFQRPEK